MVEAGQAETQAALLEQSRGGAWTAFIDAVRSRTNMTVDRILPAWTGRAHPLAGLGVGRHGRLVDHDPLEQRRHPGEPSRVGGHHVEGRGPRVDLERLHAWQEGDLGPVQVLSPEGL